MATAAAISKTNSNKERFSAAANALEGEVEVWNLTFAVAESMALKVVVTLGIADILLKANTSLSAQQIAQHLPATTPSKINITSLNRVLQLLSAKGVFAATPLPGKEEEYSYGLNNASKWLIKEGNHLSMAPLVDFYTHNALEYSAHHLPQSVLDGGHAFDKVNGCDIYAYAEKNPEFKKTMDAAIATYCRLAITALLKNYDGLKSTKSLVELSKDQGEIVSKISEAYSHIHVIKCTDADQLPSADAILLTSYLNFQNDDDAISTLKNCHRSLPKNGKLVILEKLLNFEKSEKDKLTFASASAMSDVLLMSYTKDGRERTKEDFQRLITAAGFSNFNLIRLPSFLQAIEVTKP